MELGSSAAQSDILRDEERIVPPREECMHTPCYCEENVWKLCERISKGDAACLQGACAVFISNHNRMIPIWQQRSSKDKDGVVVWDYHVILVARHQRSRRHFVYDLDSKLSFPCDFDQYVVEAIRSEDAMAAPYRRLFRVVPAERYLATFASDRSHMLKEDKKTYMATPPPYPAISTPESRNNIQDFISMAASNQYGAVLNLEQLRNKFSGDSSP